MFSGAVATRHSPRQRVCHECEVRHLKCDKLTPSCSACSRAGRLCTQKTRYKFRHDHNPGIRRRQGRKSTNFPEFERGQCWTSVSPELIFVDQSQSPDFSHEAENNLGEDDSSADEAATPRDRAQSEAGSSEVSEFFASPQLTPAIVDHGSFVLGRTYTPKDATIPRLPASILPTQDGRSLALAQRGSDDPVILHDAVAHAHITIPGVPDSSSSAISPPLPRLLPLNNDENLLLRYFMTDLISWFDYCDPKRHFTHVAVSAALSDSTLLDAFLAVSAKHMSLKGKFDRYAPDKYQRRCLEKLIPALNDRNSLLNENLFAATIVLRLLDEMTEPIGGANTRGHILGTHILVRARQDPASESTLREACLLIGLRQDIFISFMTRCAVQPLTGYCHIDRSLTPADDGTWTQRIIAHSADILNYCYGGKPREAEAWKVLNRYTEDWDSLKPVSFSSINDTAAHELEGRALPEKWYLNDSHVVGNQYLAICRLLLLSHNPQLPLLGIERIKAETEIDKQIKEQVRLICVIAISNRQFVPAMFTAGMAIAMCGERFTDQSEQRQLVDILTEAEGHVAWPSLKFQETLKAHWGMT